MDQRDKAFDSVSEASERAASSERHAERLAELVDSASQESDEWNDAAIDALAAHRSGGKS